ATGGVRPGQTVTVLPSGQTAMVAQVLDHTRQPKSILAGHSAGIVLDREVDVSRGDWLLQAPTLAASRAALPPEGALAPRGGPSALNGHDTFEPTRELAVTIAWMDDEPLVAGRVYWALHGHRWVKAKVKRIVHKLDVNTLAEEDASELPPNAIGHIELSLQAPLATLPYARSRVLGSLVLVDTASNKTSGAALIL
ncbi:MAG: sulfate adenylyltransferase, partial [Polaromonas sp.]|nr:sulfate adenylyltransferase [Polaromonas sp.]